MHERQPAQSGHSPLAEGEAWLAAVVESSQDAIITKTLDGQILTWNRSAERMFGYTADEAVGQPIYLIIPPERHEEEADILRRLARGERIEDYETVRCRKDGRLIDLSLSISPVRDRAGRIIGASKVARDITARKRSEADLLALKDALAMQLGDLRRLHQMSVRLSTTLELQPILEETLRTAVAFAGTDMGLLALCDNDEQTLYVGASQGFDDEALKIIDVVIPRAGPAYACYQSRQRVVVEDVKDVETEPQFAGYLDVARQAGIRAAHSTPLVTRSGKILGVLSTHYRQPHRPSDREMHLIDVCARQAVDYIENAQLYEQLREADRRKDEFLATLAHELRNPLAPISNSLNLLRLAEDLSPTVERLREIMERQVAHMVRLVDDLLEVSRITSGKIELRKEQVELASVVGSAVEASRSLIEAAKHQLAILLPPDPLTLEADPVRLAQVIANLLNNAAKYTPEGGQVWLSARQEASDLVLSVRDTGYGIPPEMLPHVFDMFAQIDRTRPRAQGGLGIGLTLSKSLIELHGGTIEARSAGAGQGSEFMIRLPLVASARRISPTLPAPHITRHKLPAHKILVVDDTRDAVYLMGKMLEAMGQQVRTAQNGPDALEMIRAEPPEMIISDIGMPDMDGYELARRVRELPEMETATLVALTGYGQDRDRQGAIEAGFDHYLVKPVSIASLEKILAALPAEDEAASPPRLPR